MAKVLHHKVVVALPSPLEPDAIYYVRTGDGFDIHVTNGAGVVTAYSLNASLGLDGKVDKELGYSLLPNTEITRLATMATGATKNRADSANADKVHGHDLATISKAGFMSPDHVLLLSTFGGINNIGKAGNIGFGVGICPSGYPGMSAMAGTVSLGHDNYGNYQYKDGSVMCWVPAFYYRWGNAASPHYAAHGKNACDILPVSAFPSILAAAVAGWPLHRAFWDDGAIQPGVFVDKYKCSNNGGVASSIKNGIPLSSNAANNPFSGLNGSPANIYAGAIDAAKTRGADFHPTSPFIPSMLHTLSIAHGQAATSSAVCAWYDATGVNNFPKGCNNNALGDINDPTVSYESTGYSNAGKTGSGQPFAKTTHNGQNCGVADISGGMWEVCPGLTVLDDDYYILKTSARMADLTSGATLETDAWGAAGIAKSYDSLGASHQALGSSIGSSFAIGSANQVFSNATEGKDWAAAGAGIPNLNGIGGTNLFGNDRFYDNKPQHMCLIACGAWYYAASAGPGARLCYNSRASSSDDVSFRAALYLARRSDSEGGAP